MPVSHFLAITSNNEIAELMAFENLQDEGYYKKIKAETETPEENFQAILNIWGLNRG